VSLGMLSLTDLHDPTCILQIAAAICALTYFPRVHHVFHPMGGTFPKVKFRGKNCCAAKT